MESRFPSYRRALYLNYMSAATYNFEVSPALIHPELRVPWIKTRPDDQPIAGGQRPDVADISPHRPLSHFAPLVGKWCTDRGPGRATLCHLKTPMISTLIDAEPRFFPSNLRNGTIAAQGNAPSISNTKAALCLDD